MKVQTLSSMKLDEVQTFSGMKLDEVQTSMKLSLHVQMCKGYGALQKGQ
jgi:hypothetical protein